MKTVFDFLDKKFQVSFTSSFALLIIAAVIAVSGNYGVAALVFILALVI